MAVLRRLEAILRPIDPFAAIPGPISSRVHSWLARAKKTRTSAQATSQATAQATVESFSTSGAGCVLFLLQRTTNRNRKRQP